MKAIVCVTLGLAAIAAPAVAGDRRAEIERIQTLLDAELLALDLEEPASLVAARRVDVNIASAKLGSAYLCNSGIESYRSGLVTFGHASEISALTTTGAATVMPLVVPTAARRVGDAEAVPVDAGGPTMAIAGAEPPPAKKSRKKATIAPPRPTIAAGSRAAASAPAGKQETRNSPFPRASSGKPEDMVGAPADTAAAPKNVIVEPSRSALAEKFKAAVEEGTTPVGETSNSLRWKADAALDSFFTHQTGSSSGLTPSGDTPAPMETTATPSADAAPSTGTPEQVEQIAGMGFTSEQATEALRAALGNSADKSTHLSGVARAVESAKRTVSARGKGAVGRAKAALAEKRSAQLAGEQAAQLAREAAVTALRAKAKAARAKEAVQRAKTVLKCAAAAAAPPPTTATASAPAVVAIRQKIRQNMLARRLELPSVATVVDDVTVKADEKTALPASTTSTTSYFAVSGKPGFWTGFVYTMVLVTLAVAGVVGGAGYMIMEAEGKTSRSRRSSLTSAAAFSDLASSSATSILSDDSRIRCRRHSISAFA